MPCLQHVQTHFRPASAQKIHLFTLVAASIALTLEVSVGFILIVFLNVIFVEFHFHTDRIFPEAVCDVG